ncbi:hypothetical protein [Nitratireductor sp. GCM10026969]|uniref:hypothetical protein n=1 Tax=Nitratireductor sp. GCM10026969 TaxID=3252645 RepID=UPI00360758C7
MASRGNRFGKASPIFKWGTGLTSRDAFSGGGARIVGLRDVVATPFQEATAGVRVHAEIIDQMAIEEVDRLMTAGVRRDAPCRCRHGLSAQFDIARWTCASHCETNRAIFRVDNACELGKPII